MFNPAKMISHSALIAALAFSASPASARTVEKNACSVRNADATLRSMLPLDLPPLAVIQNLSGTAVVQFDLDAKGVARNAAIVTSSGSALLDAQALKSTLAQAYAPQIRDCENIGGQYRIVVDFTPNA